MQVRNRGEELQSSAQRGEEAAGGKLSLDEHPKPKLQGRFRRRKEQSMVSRTVYAFIML